MNNPTKRPKMLASLTSKWSQLLISKICDYTVLSTPPSIGLAIGTHDGSFHCDEVLAISMLKLLPKYENSVIVRSRDPLVLGKCQIVCDVGAKYEPDQFVSKYIVYSPTL